MAALVELSNPSRLKEKQDRLFAQLGAMDRVIVAFSGGADSAYLAWAARQVLGANALAMTADSASLPESHKHDAEAFVRQFGIAHEYVETHEFDNPDYLRNDANRCFHCKDELFTVLEQVGRERGYQHIIYGVNADDLGDYRPGQNAARQHRVAAPLADAGLTKAEIRELSRQSGLPTWDRPASACLSSRIPYGTAVTAENVKTVESGEEALKAMGFRQFRVRFHGEIVRIEIAPDELAKALTLEMARRFTEIFKAIGFHYVTLDLEGYRQGSLNEVLELKK
jgi:pyridinium-3,5-biscarboxylic acid mononucleotide sulfurtransferase